MTIRLKKPSSSASKHRKELKNIIMMFFQTGEVFFNPPGGDFSVLQHFMNRVVLPAMTYIQFFSHPIDCFPVSLFPLLSLFAVWGLPGESCINQLGTRLLNFLCGTHVPQYHLFIWRCMLLILPYKGIPAHCSSRMHVSKGAITFDLLCFQGSNQLWSSLLTSYF